jgi:hypothetical protein
MKNIKWDEFVKQYHPIKTIKWDEFVKQYHPIKNEINFVNNSPLNCIWTLKDDGNCQILNSGLGVVNRMGYIVSEIPYREYTVVTGV